MSELYETAHRVGELLKQRGETVAVSESSSGGLVSAALLSVPGASAYFMGGVVVYTGDAREAYLGINLDDYPDMRSASEAYAALCASTVREKLKTTWGLSETGAAGPTGNRYGDDAGHTCVALSGPVEVAATVETGISDRAQNMDTFAIKALELIEAAIQQTE